jgi:hypothetical protein
MGSIARARLLPLLVGVLLAGAAALSPAHADTVLLTNGNLLYGQLDVTQLPVATPGGVVQVPTAELADVELATIAGVDVLRYKNGTALGGIIDRPGYSMRLASGQTVVIERWRVKAIMFRSR